MVRISPRTAVQVETSGCGLPSDFNPVEESGLHPWLLEILCESPNEELRKMLNRGVAHPGSLEYFAQPGPLRKVR